MLAPSGSSISTLADAESLLYCSVPGTFFELAGEVREAFDRGIDLAGQAATAFASTRGVMVKEPEQALERIVSRYELIDDEGEAVKRAYRCEPGETLFNVINALTRAGNDDALPIESRHKLQTLGGRLNDLSATGRWLDN